MWLRCWTGSRAVATGAVAIWALCFGIRVESALSGAPLPPFFVTADPRGGSPTLADFRAGGGAEAALHVGDRLARLGSEDLAGVGPLDLFVVVARAGRAGDEVIVHYERGDAPGSVHLQLRAAPLQWFVLASSLAWASLAALLLLRSSWTPVSRNAFWASLGIALTGALFGGSLPAVLLSLAALAAGTSAMAVFGVLFCWSFLPDAATTSAAFDDRDPARRPFLHTPGWPWLFGAAGIFEASRDFGVGLPPAAGRIGLVVTLLLAVVAAVCILFRKLPVSPPPARRQLLWALSGCCIGSMLILVALALSIADPDSLRFYRLAVGVCSVIPAAWAIAIFRYRTFDVDRLLNAATTYTITAVVLLAGGLFVYSQLLSGPLGMAGGASIAIELVVAALLMALVASAHRRLRPLLEGVFLRERIVFGDGVGRLMDELSRCQRIEDIWMRTGESLDALIAPHGCAIYLSAGQRFAPIFHRGPPMPGEIRSDHPLVAMLRDQHKPIDLQRRQRGGLRVALSESDRRGLGTLHTAVVVPIARRDQLYGFIVLGEKRSGDFYSAEDLMLLEALAHVVSAKLERLDNSTLAAIGERMVQMTHELREPLRVMSGYTEMLARAQSPQEKEEMVAIVLEQFRLMQRMVGNVLAFARGEAPLLLQTVNVGAYLQDVRRHLDPLLRGTSLTLIIGAGYIGDAIFDEGKLTRLIATIARHAIEARSGKLVVGTSAEHGRLVMALSYDGSGVPAETMARPYTPVSRAAPEAGRAAGLAAVDGILQEHGIDVHVESSREAGMTIRIALPLLPRGASATQSH